MQKLAIGVFLDLSQLNVISLWTVLDIMEVVVLRQGEFESNLTNRVQFVEFNGHSSSNHSINCVSKVIDLVLLMLQMIQICFYVTKTQTF